MNKPARIILALVVIAALIFGLQRLRASRAAQDAGGIRAAGTIEAVEVSVAPELGGRILDIGSQEGDTVAAGDVLVRLDPSLLEAQRRAAEASMEVLRATSAAQRSPQSAAQLAAAEASLAVVEAQIQRMSLTAPVAGVVLSRLAEPGEVAMPGSPILVLGRLEDLTITVYVPGDRYGRIDLGDEAALTVDAFPDRSFSAEVSHIANRAEFTPRNIQTAAGRATTVYAVRLTVTNKAERLKPGMPADVVFDE